MAHPLALGVMTQFRNNPQIAFQAIKELGVTTAQALYAAHLDSPQGLKMIMETSKSTGVEITTVFCGYAGQSYADIPAVQKTVGLVPRETRRERLETTYKIAQFAKNIGVSRVAAHIGFVPEDVGDPGYVEIVDTIKDICRHLAEDGQVFAMETGQETGAGLRQFILDVDQPNLRVNFDPANMILYGKDRPVPALHQLMEWIDGVHCKDGLWPTSPGQLGEETPLGKGDVGFSHWLLQLIALGYRGPLTIEREISGPEQLQDLAAGIALIRSLLPHTP